MRSITSSALSESEGWFRALFDNSSDGALVFGIEERRILFGNAAMCRMLQYRAEELAGKGLTEIHPEADWGRIEEEFKSAVGSPEYCARFVPVQRKDGSVFFADINMSQFQAGEQRCLLGVFRNVTEQQRAERWQALSAEVLHILNDPPGVEDATHRILKAIKRETGIEAIGIRLRAGDDFPYAVADGFSAGFVQAENSLMARRPDGEFCVDLQGRVGLECTCGLVLSGKTDPGNPLFTEGGSAWTSEAGLLLEVPGEQDPRLHPRNRCIHEGYQSVALIPIPVEGEIIGLLQLNDRRKGCFTGEMVRYLEGLAASFGVALQRRKEEQAVRESQRLLRSLFDALPESLHMMDLEGVILAANAGFANRVGRPVAACIGESLFRVVPERLVQVRRDWIAEVVQKRQPVVRDEDWGGRWFRISYCPVFGMDGQVARIVVLGVDVTERKRAEEAQMESQRLLQTVVDLVPHFIFAKDRQSRYLLANRACAAASNRKPEEMIGLCDYDFVADREQAEAFLRDDREVIDGGKPKHVAEEPLTDGQGRRRILQTVKIPVTFDKVGPALVGVAVDVTEQKLHEGQDRLHFKTLQLLAAGAPLPAVLESIVQLLEFGHGDWRGSIMLVDESGTRLVCGAAPKLPPYFQAAVNGTPIAEGAGSCGTAAATKQAVVVADIDGHPYWTKYREVASRAGLRACWSLPIVAADGGVLGAMAVYRSEPCAPTAEELHSVGAVLGLAGIAIGKRKGEMALQESEEEFRAMFEVASIGMAQADLRTGRWLRVNQKMCAITGYGMEELLRLSVLEITHPEDRERDWALFQRVVRGETPDYRVEKRYVRKDGKVVWVNVNMTLIRDGDGQPLRTMATIEEVTERKQLEAQLRQAQKLEAVGQLAGGVAHDFNNILAVMMMHVGLMQMSSGVTEEVRQALTDLDGEARRAAALTRQLLMFSRRSILAVRVVDLNEVVANLLKMLGRLIGEQVQLLFDSKTGLLPAVSADAGMLEQVLMNLVVNARDAMPKGGRITIKTTVEDFGDGEVGLNPSRRRGRFLCLAVADTGVGMDEVTLKRVFEPFFTTKEVGKGTGLGLATVHGIVAQHNGWVEVESEVGQGTTFRVYLPVAREAVTETVKVAPGSELQRGKESILLVEDEDGVRRTTGQALRLLGYRVYEAENGQAAMKQWQAHGAEVELLLTDMVMPEGMTGLELAEQLQGLKPGLKAIISSGYTAEMVQAGVPDKPGLYYLPKPYEVKKLAETVRRCLDKQAE